MHAMSNPRFSVLGCGLAALMVSCVADAPRPGQPTTAPPRPVIGGTPDDGDPAVVALVYTEDRSTIRCSGTLIAERVVLTSAHCGAQHDPALLSVLFGSDLQAGGTVIPLLAAVAHPDYVNDADHDLALLLLAAPAPATPAPMVTDDALAATPPVTVRLVGFGASDATTLDDWGRKREGTAETTEVNPQHVVLGAAPNLPCSGDSGGAVFLDTGTGEVLAGVVSRGDEQCTDYGRATRVDAHLSGFIAPQLAAWAPGSVTDGGACLYDEQCDSGRCVAAVDEPLFLFCSRACETDEDCADPLTCQAGECRYPLPSPGALGAPCETYADCLQGECHSERGVCVQRCVEGEDDCPAGFHCQYEGSVDFFCIADPQADGCGCQTGRATPPPLLFGQLLLLWLAARRRRSR